VKRRNLRNPGNAYAAALDQLDRAEVKLARSFNAWLKARKAVRSIGRKLDTMQAVQS
jgi:hypothetical protein